MQYWLGATPPFEGVFDRELGAGAPPDGALLCGGEAEPWLPPLLPPEPALPPLPELAPELPPEPPLTGAVVG